MTGRLAGRILPPDYRYFEHWKPDPAAEQPADSEPGISPEAHVRDCILGPWTRVGARTSLMETEMGAYSYIVTDSSTAYTTIGKFCSIARDRSALTAFFSSARISGSLACADGGHRR